MTAKYNAMGLDKVWWEETDWAGTMYNGRGQKNHAGAWHGLVEMVVNHVHVYKGEFVNGWMYGGLIRYTGNGTVIIGNRNAEKFYGVSIWKTAEHTYYGESVDNKREGKGWRFNADQITEAKGQFKNNKCHGYAHLKFGTAAEKIRWEGTVREDQLHGLGVLINESDGIRKHMLYEGEGDLLS